jgi:hypothetical protein
MGRKPRVDRIPEEKWQIVQEGIKSGNVWETCFSGFEVPGTVSTRQSASNIVRKAAEFKQFGWEPEGKALPPPETEPQLRLRIRFLYCYHLAQSWHRLRKQKLLRSSEETRSKTRCAGLWKAPMPACNRLLAANQEGE